MLRKRYKKIVNVMGRKLSFFFRMLRYKLKHINFSKWKFTSLKKNYLTASLKRIYNRTFSAFLRYLSDQNSYCTTCIRKRNLMKLNGEIFHQKTRSIASLTSRVIFAKRTCRYEQTGKGTTFTLSLSLFRRLKNCP